jgi:hydrogenase maturation factor HypF (carbamoyltransferase family)
MVMALMGQRGAVKSSTAQTLQRFSRLAHLEHQLLLGGDLASRYPLRLAAAMLSKAGVDVEDWLHQNSDMLPYGEMEAELILNQLKKAQAGFKRPVAAEFSMLFRRF